jgi:hypothetical protein
VGQWPPTAYGHHRVTAHGVACTCTCTSDRCEPFKCPLRLTSGPWLFSDFSRFSILQTLKSKSVTFPMSKLSHFLLVDSLKHKEQLSFLAQLQIPSGFQVTISGRNSNLNLPCILEGFKPFWKNMINSLKFPLHMIFIKVNLVGYTCM